MLNVELKLLMLNVLFDMLNGFDVVICCGFGYWLNCMSGYFFDESVILVCSLVLFKCVLIMCVDDFVWYVLLYLDMWLEGWCDWFVVVGVVMKGCKW